MDITDAISQDQIADSLVAEPQPEDSAEHTGTEGLDDSQGEEQQPVEQDADEQTSEEDADWLPGEQEKVFPDEVLAKYAQRYGMSLEELAANPSLRQLVHDKINSDVYLRQLKEQEQADDEPEAEQVAPRPTQPQPIPIQQWLQNAQQFARQNDLVNPEISQAFAKSFMGAFGVNELPQDFNPQAFTEPFVIFGMNLINSLMPHYFQAPSQTEGKNMFQFLTESNYDGLGEMAQSTQYRSAWNSAKGSNPELAKLEYGSPEFVQLMEKAEQALPGLQWMQFADKNGKPLSPKANAERQYQIAARIASGQRPNPELIRKAVQTGQRQARTSQLRKAAGNLGAGTSTSQLSGKGKGGDDDFWSNPESWNNYTNKSL